MTADRPSWDDVEFKHAVDVAGRSLCVRSRTGAMIVAADGRVVSRGYNGPPAGLEAEGPCEGWCPRGSGASHEPGYADCVAIHAEMNAILHADRDAARGGTIYVTRMPCFACAKSIAGAGIARVVAGEDGGGVYHRPEKVSEFLMLCGIEVSVYGG